MTLWSKIFGRGSNEYIYLREAFANHHHTSREELDQHHPHAVGTLALHGVDLKTIRKRAASVVAAAAVAGLLLSRPHAVGAPTQDKQQEREHTQVAAFTDTTSANEPAVKVAKAKPVKVTLTKTQVQTPPAANNGEEISQPNKGKGEKHGHRGHTRGRSYLAPPKEHGLHDLGKHKGDNKEHQIKDKKVEDNDNDNDGKGGDS